VSPGLASSEITAYVTSRNGSPQAEAGKKRTDANSRLAHEQMLANLKKGRIDVYFSGDSITRRWRATDYPQFLTNWDQNFFGWNAANFGWGADTIQNILWRLQNGELEAVHPNVIVLLAGTNNIGNSPASAAKVSHVTAGIKALLDTMRDKAPKATIILMGILPRNDGSNPTAVIASAECVALPDSFPPRGGARRPARPCRCPRYRRACDSETPCNARRGMASAMMSLASSLQLT
jgi:lysophospholipase L1-like esterase